MITDLFDIALSSIKVSQLGLDTTGNNVANVETPGYTRRSLVIEQLPHNKGAIVKQIKRESNPFVTKSWQDALAFLGYYNVRDQILNQLEGVFNELEIGGLKQSLRDFWNAWETVANDAADISLRSNLLQATKNLVINIHSKKEQLLQIRSSLDPEIEALLQEVNSLTERLTELNHKIRAGKIANQDVNNLLDERDSILRKLSEDLGINSIKNKDGQVTVLLEGQAIVMENQKFNLSSKIDNEGKLRIIWDGETDISADSIELNINDPRKIALSSSPDTIPSDNKNALAILDIKDQPFSSLDGLTIDNFYNNLISDVGTKSYLNKNNMELQNKIVENAESHFDSISGVNLDEEAVNTLKFQYMYTASARLISVASEIAKTIINMGV